MDVAEGCGGTGEKKGGKQVDVPIIIKQKLDLIYKHQMSVKRLTREVEDYFLPDYPQIDVPLLEGWTWRMHIDQQGEVYEPKKSLDLLLSALGQKEKGGLDVSS